MAEEKGGYFSRLRRASGGSVFKPGAGIVMGFMLTLSAGMIAFASLFISWSYDAASGTYSSGFDMAGSDLKHNILYLLAIGGLAILVGGFVGLFSSGWKSRTPLAAAIAFASIAVIIITGLEVTFIALWEKSREIDAGAFASFLGGIFGVLGAFCMTAKSPASESRESGSQPAEEGETPTVRESREGGGSLSQQRTQAQAKGQYASASRGQACQTSAASSQAGTASSTSLVDFSESRYPYLKHSRETSEDYLEHKYGKFRKPKSEVKEY